MPYFTVPDIIEIAELSEALATKDTLKGKMYSPRINPKLPEIIMMEVAAVRWAYSQTPTYQDIQFTANYLYDLCGKYGLDARRIITGGGGGTPVTPVTPTDDCTGMKLITSPNFEADGKTVVDTDWVDKEIFIYWNNVNKYIFSPSSWSYLPGGGFVINIPGFDASPGGPNEDVEMIVSVGCFNPGGAIFPSQFPINEIVSVDGVEDYDLVWGATYIAKYGVGSFSVSWDDDGDGVYTPTGIQPTADDPDNPTVYHFTGLGSFPVKITIS